RNRKSLPAERGDNSGKLEHELAYVVTTLHPLMRLGGLFKREDLINDRVDLAGLEHAPDTLPQWLRNRPAERHRTRTQGRPRHRQTTQQNLPQTDGRFVATQQSNEHQTTIIRKTADFALGVVTTDHIQNHIHAFAAGDFLDNLPEVLGLVID